MNRRRLIKTLSFAAVATTFRHFDAIFDACPEFEIKISAEIGKTFVKNGQPAAQLLAKIDWLINGHSVDQEVFLEEAKLEIERSGLLRVVHGDQVMEWWRSEITHEINRPSPRLRRLFPLTSPSGMA